MLVIKHRTGNKIPLNQRRPGGAEKLKVPSEIMKDSETQPLALLPSKLGGNTLFPVPLRARIPPALSVPCFPKLSKAINIDGTF